MAHDAVGVDRDWEARNDARTLIDANKIHSDAKRLKKAATALAEIEKEAEQTTREVKAARGLEKVFGKKK